MMTKKWTVLLSVLVMAIAMMQINCDEADDAIEEAVNALGGEDGRICLDVLLDTLGLDRDELDDESLADALEAQEDVLGESYVIDCEATETAEEAVTPDTTTEPEGDDTPEAGEGEVIESDGAEQVPGDIEEVIENQQGEGSEDIVILMDATGSMGDDLAEINDSIDSILAKAEEAEAKVGAAFYKDGFVDSPWFGLANGGDLEDASSASATTSFLNSVAIGGGGDLPESFYDGVVETANGINWESHTKRMIIVITDADALNPDAEGNTEASMKEVLAKKGVTLNTIIVGIAY
ncbi:MAG: VWA domain-containing protein [Deltaproteobacteria bacterium]|nr:VWA domain-containing protein [Deltaproteobacteria bacterium]